MSRYLVRFAGDQITVDVGPQAQACPSADWAAILLACAATWPEEEWPEFPDGGFDAITATEAWDATIVVPDPRGHGTDQLSSISDA